VTKVKPDGLSRRPWLWLGILGAAAVWASPLRPASTAADTPKVTRSAESRWGTAALPGGAESAPGPDLVRQDGDFAGFSPPARRRPAQGSSSVGEAAAETKRPAGRKTTSAAPPAVDPAGAAGEPLFSDAFNDCTQGWPEWDDGDTKGDCTAGEYHLFVRPMGGDFTWAENGPTVDDNVAIQVAVRSNTSEDRRSHGLLMGYTEGGSFLDFEIYPVTGVYDLLQINADGTSDVLISRARNDAVLSGTATNVLRMERRGAYVTLMANGYVLDSLAVPRIPRGQMALVVTNYEATAGAHAYFDNVLVERLGPTGGPTATWPAPSPTPTPGTLVTPKPTDAVRQLDGEEVMHDDFDDPFSGWVVVDADQARFDYVGGRYLVRSKRANGSAWASRGQWVDQFDAEVKVQMSSAPEGMSAGLVFGNSEEMLYAFEIDTAKGQFTFDRLIHSSGEWQTGLRWSDAGVIRRGNADNVLRVTYIGRQLFLYINGQYLIDVTLDMAPGQVGVIVQNYSRQDGAEALFDEVRVRRYSGSVAPTATLGAASRTPEPWPTAAGTPLPQGGELLMADDFSDPGSGWPTWDSPSSSGHYRQGEYHVAERQVGQGRYVVRGPLVDDFDAWIAARIGSDGPAEQAVGLVLAWPTGGYTEFLVDPTRGEFALTGPQRQQLSWAGSSAIRRGTAVNVLRFARLGSDVRLMVNDTVLATLQFHMPVGQLGFSTLKRSGDEAVDAYFDNFGAFLPLALPGDVATPTPGSSPTAGMATPTANHLVYLPFLARDFDLASPPPGGTAVPLDVSVRIGTGVDPNGDLIAPGAEVPQGPALLVGRIRYAALPAGTALRWQWYQGDVAVDMPGLYGILTPATADGSHDVALAGDAGRPLPVGRYGLRVYRAPAGPLLATAELLITASAPPGPTAEPSPTPPPPGCREWLVNGTFDEGPKDLVLNTTAGGAERDLARVVRRGADVRWRAMSGEWLAILGGGRRRLDILRTAPFDLLPPGTTARVTLSFYIGLMTDEVADGELDDVLRVKIVSADEPNYMEPFGIFDEEEQIDPGDWHTTGSNPGEFDGVVIQRRGWTRAYLEFQSESNDNDALTQYFLDTVSLVVCTGGPSMTRDGAPGIRRLTATDGPAQHRDRSSQLRALVPNSIITDGGAPLGLPVPLWPPWPPSGSR
jgi:hypothetical protein